jgi:hypothetical protein
VVAPVQTVRIHWEDRANLHEAFSSCMLFHLLVSC